MSHTFSRELSLAFSSRSPVFLVLNVPVGISCEARGSKI